MKKLLRNISPILLILIGLTVMSFTAGKNPVLKLHLESGKTYTINTKTTQLMMMNIQGQSMSMQQIMENTIMTEVKDVTNDKNVIESQMKRIKLTIKQAGMSFTYDSDHPEETSPMLAANVGEMSKELDKVYTIVYDNWGKEIGNEEAAGNINLASFIIELPQQPMEVGTTWENEQSQDINGQNIVSHITYTVNKVSKKAATLTYTGTIMGSVTGNDVDGTSEGTLTLDLKTGIVTSNVAKQNISMTIEQQGMSIPVTVSQNIEATIE